MIFCKLFKMSEGSSQSNARKSDDSDNEDNPPQNQSLRLDLGDLSQTEMNRLGPQNPGTSGLAVNDPAPKREDNPFSFKHFLRSDSANYQHKGARPKVYCENRPTNPITEKSGPSLPSTDSKQTRKVTEFSSALPDFVQDHLVIEQCYLGSNNYNLEVNNLPDFTPNSRQNLESIRQNHLRNDSNHDLSMPLDLPGPPLADFPLDLPISSGNLRNCPTSSSEVGNSKSLPDFLADSAVCAQKSENISAANSPEGDGDRLRREFDIVRRQLMEQTRICDNLRRELDMAKNKEHEYTQNLGKALEDAEKNLEKSNRRAASAESTVIKLRQEIKSLMAEISHLKFENESLKGEEASGGHSFLSHELHSHQSHRLARELRTAASTAEQSLRQLLTGVDNLRIMASTLESMHRVEEKVDPFSNFDEGAGPAL